MKMEVKLQATVFYCHQVKLNKRTFSRLSKNTNKIINLTKKKEPFPAAQYHIFSQSYSTTYQNRFFLRKFISRKSCNIQSFDVGHFFNGFSLLNYDTRYNYTLSRKTKISFERPSGRYLYSHSYGV